MPQKDSLKNMDTCKNVEGITRKLQTCLNIDLDHLTQADVNKILNLQFPIKEVDNLIKITNHTNVSLEQLKTSLVKNRNLMAEEISCFNEYFANTSYEVDFDSSNATAEEISSDGAGSSSPSSQGSHSESKKTNPKKADTEELRKENIFDPEYQTRQLLSATKSRLKEGLGTPPPVFKMN